MEHLPLAITQSGTSEELQGLLKADRDMDSLFL
jgi:hypothetical protein